MKTVHSFCIVLCKLVLRWIIRVIWLVNQYPVKLGNEITFSQIRTKDTSCHWGLLSVQTQRWLDGLSVPIECTHLQTPPMRLHSSGHSRVITITFHLPCCHIFCLTRLTIQIRRSRPLLHLLSRRSGNLNRSPTTCKPTTRSTYGCEHLIWHSIWDLSESGP